MANSHDPEHSDSATDASDETRVTPREVEPDSARPGGEKPRSSGRTLREDTSIEDAAGGDRSGVAGGGVDGNVSGLGGGNRR